MLMLSVMNALCTVFVTEAERLMYARIRHTPQDQETQGMLTGVVGMEWPLSYDLFSSSFHPIQVNSSDHLSVGCIWETWLINVHTR